MTINHEKKLIFVNIPKNAGTSTIQAVGLRNVFMDKTIEEYKDHYQDYWYKYTKFTVIRDPIDRFISAYKFARMDENGWFSATGKEGLGKHPHYDICNSVDINGYVKYLYKNPKKFNRWVIPQKFHIQNINGQIEIDYFVKYENFLEDLNKIGIYEVSRLNKSTIDDENFTILTKESKIKLYEIYDIDYQNLPYEKEKIFSYK